MSCPARQVLVGLETAIQRLLSGKVSLGLIPFYQECTKPLSVEPWAQGRVGSVGRKSVLCWSWVGNQELSVGVEHMP